MPTTTSSNAKEDAMEKALKIFDQKNIFNKIPLNAKQISPLNNIKLKEKERKVEREQTAGKAWGEMPK